MTTKKARRHEWITLIENYKASGLTMAAWCAANQFTLHTLKYWLSKLKGISSSSYSTTSKQSSPSVFVPLTVKESRISVSAPSLLVVRIGEASIELRSGFDPRLLQEVVQVLRSSC